MTKEQRLEQATIKRYNNYSLETLYKYYDYGNVSFVIEDGCITKVIYGC